MLKYLLLTDIFLTSNSCHLGLNKVNSLFIEVRRHTRRDHVSVVMDAGSRIVNFIVNFIRDGKSSHNSEIYNIGA